jgi:hypothetical protein
MMEPSILPRRFLGIALARTPVWRQMPEEIAGCRDI